MRNVGIKNLHRRGKVYYYVAHGRWTSLGTRDRAEARRHLAKLREHQITLRFLQKSGLLLLQNLAQSDASATSIDAAGSLAPTFAKAALPDFAKFTREFVARMPCPSKDNRRIWKTCGNKLVDLLETLHEFEGEDLRPLSLWEKLWKLSKVQRNARFRKLASRREM